LLDEYEERGLEGVLDISRIGENLTTRREYRSLMAANEFGKRLFVLSRSRTGEELPVARVGEDGVGDTQLAGNPSERCKAHGDLRVTSKMPASWPTAQKIREWISSFPVIIKSEKVPLRTRSETL
jgi:hypothetical protein